MIYKINIAKHFSPLPHGKLTKDNGEFAAERFTDENLKLALEQLTEHDTLEIDFNGILIPANTAFLMEAFQGAIRKGFTSKDKLLKIIQIKETTNHYNPIIKKLIYEMPNNKTHKFYSPTLKSYIATLNSKISHDINSQHKQNNRN